MEDHTSSVSDNLSALREVVNIQIPATSARWEIFGTPEYKGSVPGPTDFTTLIAELQPADGAWFASQKETADASFVAPEAARPWLSEPFHRLLAEHKNTTADLSALRDCRRYATTLKQSGSPVQGFVSGGDRHLLLYVTLSSPQ
ncbi:hypothetical protein [Duganella violaceipulchra]|uniref:Uncharacterized protein n=1 Tax=Duganella violaceipulchra TaxID=2849652 RepID=A0AA41L5L9_9BURK|nr:hypothetical protein [Duganella violaceicalia]MBV6319330.1 hypothetical protein [Duganella violaceicalia]MCP2006858.1 hypothetical protein [Duganella violaceicalia]